MGLPDFMDNDIALIIERLDEASSKALEIVELEGTDPYELLGLSQAKAAILKIHADATLKIARTLKTKLDLLSEIPAVSDLASLEEPTVWKSNKGARLSDPKTLSLAEAIARDQKERKKWKSVN